MGGYSGETSFDFEIERYKDKESGRYLTHSAVPDEGDDFEYEYTLLNLKIEGRAYFSPGRRYGPPESCYPDEGETEITAVIGPDGKDWEDQLTKVERVSILDTIQDNVSNDCPDYDDTDDYYDEE